MRAVSTRAASSVAAAAAAAPAPVGLIALIGLRMRSTSLSRLEPRR